MAYAGRAVGRGARTASATAGPVGVVTPTRQSGPPFVARFFQWITPQNTGRERAMALSRRIARPLLASIFIVGGWDALWNPEGKSKKAEAVSQPLGESVGSTTRPQDACPFQRRRADRRRGPPGGREVPAAGLYGPDRFDHPDDVCRAPVLGGVGSIRDTNRRCTS